MAKASAQVPYRPSPAGVFVHPWLNKPDTKYNADGQYKVGLRMEGKAAEDFRTVIDAAVDAAFSSEMDELPEKDRKKFSKYYPYEVEEDDKGNPTGAVTFRFKQNAVIKVEGERKDITMRLFDSTDKEVHAQVFGGTIGRVMYKARPVKIDATAKQAGVSLAFVKVQIIKLADRSSQGGGFGAVEGGYEGDPEDAAQGTGGFGSGDTVGAGTAEPGADF